MSDNILEKIEQENEKIATLKDKLIVAKKVQLHAGIEGFESPKAYGVYRNTGGNPLGVVGDSFNPMDLSMFLDAIVNSITNSSLDLDVDALQYKEYKGGSKVSFVLPMKNYEIESPMVGDIISTELRFNTGFDGKTKTSISYFTRRLWCKNGASSVHKEVEISFKNTKNSQNKALVFCDNLVQGFENVEDYVKKLNELVKKPITQKEIDEYFLRVFGVNRHTKEEEGKQKKRKQNVFDKINEATLIELNNTGYNLFSLLQGSTRYFTHELAEGDEEKLIYSTINDKNQTAHQVAFSMLN